MDKKDKNDKKEYLDKKEYCGIGTYKDGRGYLTDTILKLDNGTSQKEKSDTPRTDKHCIEVLDNETFKVVATDRVYASFARCLERELNETKAELNEIKTALKNMIRVMKPLFDQ